MSTVTKQAMRLMEVLPEDEQCFALEFIRKLVLAWDPDFSKATPSECAEMEQAIEEALRGDTVPHEAIRWD